MKLYRTKRKSGYARFVTSKVKRRYRRLFKKSKRKFKRVY